jgi:hypothetical protein
MSCWFGLCSRVRRTLEEEPLLSKVCVVASMCEADLLILVVLLNKVLNDGAGLPDGEVGVGVVDSWHTPIGVDGGEFGLLEDIELQVFDLVGQIELFANHGDLGRVGATLAVYLDGLHGGRHDVMELV